MNTEFSEPNHPLHHLLTYCHHKFARLFARQLKLDYPELELVAGQPRILFFLNHHKGAYQRQIADGCLLEPSTLSLILRKMEKANLIKRGQQGKNRKNSVVSLTPQGIKAAECVEQVVNTVENNVLSECSVKERQILGTILSRVCAQEEQLLNEMDMLS